MDVTVNSDDILRSDARIRELESNHATLSRLLDAERDKVSKLEAENKSLKNDEEFAGMDAAIQRLKTENAALKARKPWDVGDSAWSRLRMLLDTPHEHGAGMNECSICDKSLVIDAADVIEALRAKLERAEKALLLIETIQVNMGSVDCARIAARYRYSEETK